MTDVGDPTVLPPSRLVELWNEHLSAAKDAVWTYPTMWCPDHPGAAIQSPRLETPRCAICLRPGHEDELARQRWKNAKRDRDELRLRTL